MAAYEKSMSDGLISINDKVILFNCATGLKYPLPEVLNKLDKNKTINYNHFL